MFCCPSLDSILNQANSVPHNHKLIKIHFNIILTPLRLIGAVRYVLLNIFFIAVSIASQGFRRQNGDQATGLVITGSWFDSSRGNSVFSSPEIQHRLPRLGTRGAVNLLPHILRIALQLSLYRGADKFLARPGKETSYSNRRFWVSCILFIIKIGGILVLFIYITRRFNSSGINKLRRMWWMQNVPRPVETRNVLMLIIS